MKPATVVLCIMFLLAGALGGYQLKDQRFGEKWAAKPTPRYYYGSLSDAKWERHAAFGGAEWVFYRSTDGTRVAATWQESGKFSFTYPFDEFLYVVKGRAKVSVRGGESFELREGDVAYFEEGLTVDFEMLDGFTDVTMLISDKPVKWR